MTVAGAEAIRRIVEESPHVKVLVLSASREEPDVLEAVEVGAAGYLLKSATRRSWLPPCRGCGRAPVFTPLLAGLVLAERESTDRPRGRRPDKEPGAAAVHLAQVAEAHQVVRHAAGRCSGCDADLAGAPVIGVQVR